MAARVFGLAPAISVTAGLVLAALAGLRVILSRRLQEATERDGGRYWRSLPWEVRREHLRWLAVVSWAFSLVFVATLAFGVWCAYYGWNRAGL